MSRSRSRASRAERGRRPAAGEADGAGRSTAWWVLVVGGVAVALAASALLFVSLLDRDDPALEVGGWSYSRDELEADLDAISTNQAYRYVREQEGRPLPEPADGGYDPDLVAEVLTDRLTFRLAEVALAERGGEVTATDREDARRTLLQALVAGPQVQGGSVATLDVVLEEFGPWGPTLEDGVATLAALGRVLEAEAVAGGADPATLDGAALTFDALRAAGDAEGVAVADDLGTYDPASVTVLPVGASGGELAPLGDEEVVPGSAPALDLEPVEPTEDEPAPTEPAADEPAPAGPVGPPSGTGS